MSRDIDDALDGWEYKPDVVQARVTEAGDGRDVIQMRLDLGVLQLELAGRPDGQAVTAEDVRSVLFRTVRMGSGYDEQAVDDELDRLERVLAERAKQAEQNANTPFAPASAAPPMNSVPALMPYHSRPFVQTS